MFGAVSSLQYLIFTVKLRQKLSYLSSLYCVMLSAGQCELCPDDGRLTFRVRYWLWFCSLLCKRRLFACSDCYGTVDCVAVPHGSDNGRHHEIETGFWLSASSSLSFAVFMVGGECWPLAPSQSLEVFKYGNQIGYLVVC